MPTWLMGLFVKAWIARSATERPPEQPDVAGRRGRDGVVEGESRPGHAA
jgi:hypothetical protein